MRLINRIVTIARKEAVSIGRDGFSLLILLVMPAIIIVMFGYALRFELNLIPFAAIDSDQSSLSRELISRIDISHNFRFAGYLNHNGEISRALSTGKKKMVVAIPEGFSKPGPDGGVPELFIDAEDPVLATAIEYTAGQIITDFLKEVQSSRLPAAKENKHVAAFLYNHDLKSVTVPIPGLVMIILILISSIMLSLSINREREQGSSRLLMLTPATMNNIIVGKSIPYLCISLLHIASIWWLSSSLFGLHVAGSKPLFFTLCLVFIFNSMAYGLLLAAWVRTEQALLISCWIFLFIPNVFFSGFIFPTSTMAAFIEPVAKLFPGTSFIDAYRGIVFRASGMAENSWLLGNLMLQAIIAYAIAWLGFQRNYTSQ
jgi:ABC-2 type transport system permease protein